MSDSLKLKLFNHSVSDSQSQQSFEFFFVSSVAFHHRPNLCSQRFSSISF